MGREIDLLKNYPKTKRDPLQRAAAKSAADRQIARQFGREFFDGERRHGYGGYRYNPRFWQPVVTDFVDYFGLGSGSRILDVGCAKGFMLYDFRQMIPGIEVRGIDVSEYAIANAKAEVKPFLEVGDARKLPFADNSFDLVISINTVHNLERDDCALALREIERVSNGKSFVTVDAYRNEAEKEMMLAWNLTAKTIMPTTQWQAFFADIGYAGDYYWFFP